MYTWTKQAATAINIPHFIFSSVNIIFFIYFTAIHIIIQGHYFTLPISSITSHQLINYIKWSMHTQTHTRTRVRTHDAPHCKLLYEEYLLRICIYILFREVHSTFETTVKMPTSSTSCMYLCFNYILIHLCKLQNAHKSLTVYSQCISTFPLHS